MNKVIEKNEHILYILCTSFVSLTVFEVVSTVLNSHIQQLTMASVTQLQLRKNKETKGNFCSV